MASLQGNRLQDHVNATICEILANYEKSVGPFRHAPIDAAGELAAELSAVIETLPQARLRERLLSEVQHLLKAPR
jgi:hypothetical protein